MLLRQGQLSSKAMRTGFGETHRREQAGYARLWRRPSRRSHVSTDKTGIPVKLRLLKDHNQDLSLHAARADKEKG